MGRGFDGSSFHSTLNALKGLLYHESVDRWYRRRRAARRGGEEYLLRRFSTKRLSTGEPVAPWMSRSCAYPPRWVYSVLNAAEYFRAAPRLDGRATGPADGGGDRADPRRPAAGRLLAPGGTARRPGVVRGRRGREPSKWLTHSATRVLEWWDAKQGADVTAASLA